LVETFLKFHPVMLPWNKNKTGMER